MDFGAGSSSTTTGTWQLSGFSLVLAGSDGKKLTARLLRARLEQEALGNVAIKIVPTVRADTYEVHGRGEGAEGVGRATTEAVVYSSITILIVNFFLTLSLGAISAWRVRRVARALRARSGAPCTGVGHP